MNTLSLSLFENFDNARVAGRRHGTWSDFADILKEPLPATLAKTELPLWALADFEHAHRNEENVYAINAWTLDVDEDPIPDAYELIHALFGLRAVCYSSSSATASQPRWRASIALSRPVSGVRCPPGP